MAQACCPGRTALRPSAGPSTTCRAPSRRPTTAPSTPRAGSTFAHRSSTAEGLQRLGLGRGFRRVQLRTLQLADLRVRAQTDRAVLLTRIEWCAIGAAAGTDESTATDAAAEAVTEALSKARIRP